MTAPGAASLAKDPPLRAPDHFQTQRTRKGNLMMPQHAPHARVCRDCDGHATAHITTGTRNLDGTRQTMPVHCPACKGTGHTAPAGTLIRARG